MSRKSIGIAVALAAATAIPATAFAATYAVSVSKISNFTLAGASIAGWVFSQDMAINGAAPADADGTAGPAGGTLDVNASCAPAIACTSFLPNANDFNAHGPVGSGYTYADALISSSSITSLAGGAASAIAETYVTGANTGFGSSSNSLTATMTTGASGAISFNFDVLSYLAVMTSGAGDSGISRMNVSISILPMIGNVPVWSFQPNELDVNIGPNNQTYNVPDLVNNIVGTYTGNTILTGNTQYKLSISMTQNVEAVSAVPVPAAAWLFGSGLIGLVGITRRKKA